MPRSNPVRLGLMPPLSGIVGLYGREISWAGEIATELVNESGGVLGRPVELVVEDDGSVPEKAVPAAERLVGIHGCAALIGNLLSSSRIAVAGRVAAPRRVPYLNFSFYEGSIAEPFFFHFAALPNQQIEKMIPFMVGTFGAKMYFAGHDYEWPRGSIDAAKRALLQCGGEILAEEYMPMGTDFEPLLERVSCSGADVFVPYFAGSDQQKLLTLFTTWGLKRRMQVVMGHFDEAMASSLPPDVREGFWSSNTYFMSLETEENAAYLARLARHPGVDGIWPHGNGVLTNFGEGTYLCVLAWAKAVNTAGTLAPDAVAEALRTVAVRGPQGLVVMDPRTRHAAVNTYLARCRHDGTFEIVRSFGRTEPQLPARYATPSEAARAVSANGHEWRLVDHRPQAMLGATAEQPGTVEILDRLAGGRATFARGASATAVPPPRPLVVEDCGALIANAEGDVALANEVFARATGFSTVGACVGRQAAAFWSRDVSWSTMVRAADVLDLWIGDAVILDTSGARVACLVAVVPLRDDQGEVRAYSVLTAPTSDRERCARLTARAMSATETMVLVVDPATATILDANAAATRELQHARAELTSLSVEEVFSPAYRRAERARVRALATNDAGVIAPHETAAYRKDGTELVAESAGALAAGEGERRVLLCIRSIADARRAAQLAEWNTNHDPVTGLPTTMLMQRRLTNALARSKATSSLVGVLFIRLVRCEALGEAERDTLVRSLAQRLCAALRGGETLGRTDRFELAVICERIGSMAALLRRGDELAAEVEAATRQCPVSRTLAVKVAAVLGHDSALEVLRDIANQLHSSEERYRSLIESSPHGIVECDAFGIVTLANPAWQQMHGFQSDARAVGRGVWEHIVDAATADALRASIRRSMEGAPAQARHLVQVRRADGSVIDVQIDWNAKRDAAGRKVGLVAMFTDVTAELKVARTLRELNDALEMRVRQRTSELEAANTALQTNIRERELVESELRVSEERFRGIFEQAADGILLVDADARVFDVNPSLVGMLGFERDEIIGTRLETFILPGSGDFRSRYEDVASGRRSSFESELRCRRKDGTALWVRARVGMVRDCSRRFAFAFVLVQDIEQAKALEEQRALVTKELDHRVKNNLAALLSLLAQSSKSSATKEELVATFGARLRGMARVHELLASTSWSEIEIAKLIETVVRPIAPPETCTTCGPPVMIAAASAAPLGMALAELTLNAATHGALASTGHIDLEWRLDPNTDRLVVTWSEHVGRPLSPGKPGLGIRLVQGIVRHELGGEASYRFDPEGVVWTLAFRPSGRLGNGKSTGERGDACEFSSSKTTF